MKKWTEKTSKVEESQEKLEAKKLKEISLWPISEQEAINFLTPEVEETLKMLRSSDITGPKRGVPISLLITAIKEVAAGETSKKENIEHLKNGGKNIIYALNALGGEYKRSNTKSYTEPQSEYRENFKERAKKLGPLYNNAKTVLVKALRAC